MLHVLYFVQFGLFLDSVKRMLVLVLLTLKALAKSKIESEPISVKINSDEAGCVLADLPELNVPYCNPADLSGFSTKSYFHYRLIYYFSTN